MSMHISKDTTVCPFSPSCFTCPENDCRLSPTACKRMNKLPTDTDPQFLHKNTPSRAKG